jgi:hypothetical protein
MSSDAASGHVPVDDGPEQPAGAGQALDGDLWNDDEVADALGDAVSANWFSAEIENVNASDWEADAAQIWDGDDGDSAGDADAGLGLDFSL